MAHAVIKLIPMHDFLSDARDTWLGDWRVRVVFGRGLMAETECCRCQL